MRARTRAYTRVRPGMEPILPRPLETCDERFEALLAERERAKAALLGNATEGEPIPVHDVCDVSHVDMHVDGRCAACVPCPVQRAALALWTD